MPAIILLGESIPNNWSTGDFFVTLKVGALVLKKNSKKNPHLPGQILLLKFSTFPVGDAFGPAW